MKITSLPKDLNLSFEHSVQLFDYRIFDSIAKSKIDLEKNTFSFLIEGTKAVIGHNQSTPIQNDKFLIIKSGNCLMTETISETKNIYRSILLFFDNDVLLNFIENNQFKSPSQIPPKNFLVCEYDMYIRQFVGSLEQLIKQPKQVQQKLLQLKFEEILTYLVSLNGSDFLFSFLNNQDDKLAKMVNVVESNKLQKLSLQELSFLCNMSISSFKRAFIKQYQITPSKWFQEKRLEHAAFQLKSLKKRPVDIYDEAGYERFSNFIQAFKKQFGVTPKQFQAS